MLKASNFLSLSYPKSWNIPFFSVTCEFHKVSIQTMLVSLNHSKQFLTVKCFSMAGIIYASSCNHYGSPVRYLILSSACMTNILVTFCCCDKTITKNILGRKQFVSAYKLVYHEGKTGEELNAGMWRLELKQRRPKDTVYWLASSDLLSLLPYTI